MARREKRWETVGLLSFAAVLLGGYAAVALGLSVVTGRDYDRLVAEGHIESGIVDRCQFMSGRRPGRGGPVPPTWQVTIRARDADGDIRLIDSWSALAGDQCTVG